MPVLDPRLLGLDELAFLGQQATARLERLLAYAENISMCRSLQLRRYFGEETSEPCGTCDVCKGRHDREPSSGSYEAIKDQLLGWLTSEGPLPYIDLLERRGAGQRAQREHVLRALLQEGVCRMTTELEVKLVSEA
jgi:ATP-dependent DNA helicase RecQ